ncbi:MAG: hypothetical protein Q9227_009428 [Pyrenula ochraceoflavens]
MSGHDTKISDKVYNFCRDGSNVTNEVAKEPTKEPQHIAHHLYGEGISHTAHEGWLESPSYTDEDLQRARDCGSWGDSAPSELFLKVYHDVLTSLNHNHLAGNCSPGLLGSNGVVPLTVISTIQDICRHMSNLIVRAEKEVFLATNFWAHSDASTYITNALKELSRRAGDRGQKRIVKVLYDRGNLKQILDNHQIVEPETYTTGQVKLPSPEEVPNLEMEVMNFHRPAFGTMHAKFMVVDRKIAVTQSNNILDNDNMEMLVQLEGPIVDAVYDMALNTWHKSMKPSLPCIDTPALSNSFRSSSLASHKEMFDQNGLYKPPSVDKMRSMDLPEHTTKDPHYDVDIASEVLRCQASFNPRDSETYLQAITRHLNTTIQPQTVGTAPSDHEPSPMTPFIPHAPQSPFPIALVCRPPFGPPFMSHIVNPQNAAFLSAIANATSSIFIQTPNLNAAALLPQLLAAVRRRVRVTYYVCLGYNDGGELLPYQGGVNEMVAHQLYSELSPDERGFLDVHYYVGKDMKTPIHNSKKTRSCHVKLLIVDEKIAVQGSGNQDTQSWCHSQEVNVLIDSSEVCKAWREGIEANQNTAKYGKAQKFAKEGNNGETVDEKVGCWVDPETGKQAEGAVGINPGRFSWARGAIGAVQRVRGLGGFA